MIALADQSDIALWDWRVWAVLVAAALVMLAAHALTRAPEQEPELSWLDQADGVTCHRGHYYRLNPNREAYTCAGCGHQVDRAGAEL